MQEYELSDFKLGWIIGNFIPSIHRTPEIEIGIKHYIKGQTEARHKQKTAKEITVVISGSIRMENLILQKGQILMIEPGEYADFEAVTDCSLVCIKFPSIPDDKVLA